MLPKNPYAVIFDMDGVLVDSEPLHEEAVRTVATKYGIELTKEDIFSFKGMRVHEVMSLVREKSGEPSNMPSPDELVKEKNEMLYAVAEQKAVLISGAVDFLKVVRGGIQHVALATAS